VLVATGAIGVERRVARCTLHATLLPACPHSNPYAYLRNRGAVPHLIQVHQPVLKKLPCS